MYNSTGIPNITNKNNHCRIIYKNEEKGIELPSGSYEISAMNEYIQKEIKDHGLGNLLEIKANNNTLQCIIIELKEDDLMVDFEGADTLKNLLGFNKSYISGIGLNEGTQLVNVTPLNSILVNCSVIEGSYLNGEQKPILYIYILYICIHSECSTWTSNC